MSSKLVNQIMLNTSQQMLKYVEQRPFVLRPRDRTHNSDPKRIDPEWCHEYEQAVRIGEVTFWEEKVEFYGKAITNQTEQVDR